MSILCAAAAAALVCGCDDGGSNADATAPSVNYAGGESASPFLADLDGEWDGLYERPDYSEPVTATIEQVNHSLKIQTSKGGFGHLLTGRISSDNHIRLTDSFDGETWTSDGPVSGSRFAIHDYLLEDRTPGELPEQSLRFWR